MSETSLGGVLEGVRRHLTRRLGAWLVLALAAVVGTVLVLAWLLAGVEGWRAGTPVPLLLVSGGGAAMVALAVWGLSLLRSWTAEASLAGEMERFARLPEGAVRAQAELMRSLPAGVSGSLARAGEGALLGRLRDRPDRLAGGPGRRVERLLRIAGSGLALAAGAAILLLSLTPDRTRTAWAGLTRPAALLLPDRLAPLELRPGDARLPRGEPPAVEILAEGRDSVTLHWQEVGDVARSRTVPVLAGAAETALPPLEVEVRYWAASADGARTADHRLTPTDPSLLSDLTVEVTYPPHTRIFPETLRGVPPELVLPEGTNLGFSGGVEGEGSEVLLLDEGGEAAVRLSVEEGRFSGSWRPDRSGPVTWAVAGELEGAVLPPPLRIELVPDRAPTLAFPLPGADGELPLSLQVPLLLEAADDYGVAWIEIETALQGPEGIEEGTVVDRIPVGDRTNVVLRPTLDFSEWGIRPGDEVLLRARAADNAPSPQVVETETFTLRMPLYTELRDVARGRIDEAASRTEELLDRATREAQELRELERRMELEQGRPPAAGSDREAFEEREEVRQALERQAELAREIEELQERLEESVRSLPEDEPADGGLRARMEELERILEEILGPEASERLQELLDGLREGEMPESPSQLMRETAQRQEDLTNRLEQALERLRRSVIEESFRGAEEELQSLIERQQEVAESLRDGEGVEEQREVARNTEALEERLEALEDRLRSENEPEVADRTAEAGREVAEAREAMERGAQESQAGNDDAAQEQAAEAAQDLQEALDQLEEARSEWADEWEDGMREGLRRGAQDALSLARRQAELRQEFQSAGPARWRELEGDEAALLEGLRTLSGDLEAATRQMPALGQELTGAVAVAAQAAQRTLEGLRRNEGPQSQPVAAAEQAQQALHEVALLALAGLEQGAEGGEAGVSAEQILAELEALAAAQESLNQGTSDLGDDPGQDGATQRLEELSLAQEMIAGQLGDLSEQAGSGQIPGNLEALSEEGREIAEELRGGRLDATTLQRQDQFLDRLLSAGRTLEREGPTEEREGTTATAVERRVVSPLPEFLLDALAVPLPSAGEMEALSPGQRRLVLDYFDRINRRQAGGGEP